MTRTRGAFVLTLGFVALLASAVWLFWTVDGAVAYQRDVRLAQRARSTVFRLQLDAESGMRGFTSTGEIQFLAPYGAAQAQFASAFFDLTQRLRTLRTPHLISLVDDEKAVRDRWHDEVAAPLLAHPHRADATLLQTQGRRLMERFRADDHALDDGVNRAAADADFAVNIALARIAIVTGLLGLGFAGLYFYFSHLRARMSAETSHARSMYESEKRIADELQAAFGQKALPVIPNLQFHASYVPAGAQARVGGDWYDAFAFPDGRILFSIGDVAGHGIEAAVIMSRARQAIISSALHERDPAVVLSRANETLMLQEPKMVTAVCGYIDPASLRIVYATAGHPTPVLALPGREPLLLEHDGIPLGIFPDAQYTAFTAQACKGALLVLYTDGVIEHHRDPIEGERQLLDAARNVAIRLPSDPASSLRLAIFGDSAPDDDVAIMTVSFAHVETAQASPDADFTPNRHDEGWPAGVTGRA